MKKLRILDLVQNKFKIDEKSANGLIMAGKVIVNDRVICKTGEKVDVHSEIRIKELKKYVSRGGGKLEPVLDELGISVKNKTCLDIGSSTGGFTEVLLLKGANTVYAVDCGDNQLSYKLRINQRVKVYENVRIQELGKDLLTGIDFTVSDLSFTSTVLVINDIVDKLDLHEILILIKPQFEYERLKKLLSLQDNFTGIILDNEITNKIIDHVKNEFENMSMVVNNIIKSPVKGTKGNQEFFFHLLRS